ncbi:phosphatase PAP2 family protein [Chryseolinea sp. T2]|uniref:phosphatase PAP2 family protein n=1 Tax=Chryseolinea sp. T2 TaxID=3129255 RepID=UPI0030773560
MALRHVLVLLLTSIPGFALVGQPLASRSFANTIPQLLVDTVGINSKAYFSTELSRAIVPPLLLVSAGLYATTDNEWLNKYEVKEERDERMPHFRCHVDDYLQYAPIVAVYGLNLAGVKGRNDFVNRTVLLLKSEILVGVLTYSLKQITAVPRPDTGKPTSMPSGHTAQAFAAATFMAKEYGHRSIWYSIGAYTAATSVGVMRVLNNRHWASDILVGAGVGIFSTNMAYLTHRYKWGNRDKPHGTTLFVPGYDGQSYSLAMIHQFK